MIREGRRLKRRAHLVVGGKRKRKKEISKNVSTVEKGKVYRLDTIAFPTENRNDPNDFIFFLFFLS